MQASHKASAFILGALIFLGLTAMGYLLSGAVIKFKVRADRHRKGAVRKGM